MKDADGHNTCNEANQTSEHDKPPIMVFRDAGKNAEHSDRSLVNISTIDPIGFLRVNFLQCSVACLSKGKPKLNNGAVYR
ncbi:hypothetical protein IVB18_00175 [Bradyrhizobium sp. 186]|uniref:hypothetical protein n=1 Tax=Bradyrhizobium sp. 186 TaxID=2782654 RepID=UPI002000DC07|nr:hypothetical protein [Bradyrhizobium sp. 186]UPK40746.1 hypothetical protein IVB18_00175 [Bradyrhizobium sp. 186]